jgi:hypothetical protein
VNVQAISDFATATVGDIDEDSVAFAKKSIRLRYQLLYGAHNWVEAQKRVTVGPYSNTGDFYLPLDCELILYVVPMYGPNPSDRGVRLAYAEQDWLDTWAGGLAGGYAPRYFYRGPNVALPTSNVGSLSFSVKDTSPIAIYVAGEDANGNPLSERLIANTTDPSTPARPVSTNSYSVVTTLSKDISVYPVGVTAGDGTTASIGAQSTELVYTKGTVFPAIGANPVSLNVGVKLRADILDDDHAVPRVSRLWNPLLSFTIAALYKRQRQLAKAQAEVQDAQAMIQAAVSEEHNQAAFRQQAVPTNYDAVPYPDDQGPW